MSQQSHPHISNRKSSNESILRRQSRKAGDDFTSMPILSIQKDVETSDQSRNYIETAERRRISNSSHRIEIQNLLNNDHGVAADMDMTSRTRPIQKLTCDEGNCGKSFITVESLNLHRRRKHACPTSIVCHICHCSFSTSANLDKHVCCWLIFIFSSLFRSQLAP